MLNDADGSYSLPVRSILDLLIRFSASTTLGATSDLPLPAPPL